jgi:MarR family transcriptional repressor of emrRAB
MAPLCADLLGSERAHSQGRTLCHTGRVHSDSHLPNVLGALALSLATEVEEAIEDSGGLRSNELSALMTLANWADGESFEVLRVASGLSQPGCARLVDRLEAAGLARRETAAGDARVTAVRITARGRRTAAKVGASREHVIARWLDRLSTDERAALSPLLDRLLEQAHVAAPDPGVFRVRCCRQCDPDACGMPERCPTAGSV